MGLRKQTPMNLEGKRRGGTWVRSGLDSKAGQRHPQYRDLKKQSICQSQDNILATQVKLISFLRRQNHSQFKTGHILFIQNRVGAIIAPYISTKVDKPRQRHLVPDLGVGQIWV